MKTEDELLISFMYREGYTEEDMYDEKTLSIARSSINFRLLLLQIHTKRVFGIIGNNLKQMWTNIKNAFQPVAAFFEEIYKEQPAAPKNKPFKIIESKNISSMSHQVDNRKPRHLVKKIIY